ncbi:MAG: N-acetylneuraminate synthase family protein [Coriobacteriia bacterium]|nr:N-acetylneuraminate synthase family protein [Coriobacteriia bacterium]
MSVHIIAEAGTNHGGDLATAKRLVDTAAAAGADTVKFQIIYPEGLYLPSFYRNGHYEDNAVFIQRAAAMLSDDDYRELAEYGRSSGIPFTATVFDLRGIALVDELDVPYIKTASCDLNNSRLLVACAETGRRVVISTGMASLGEIERAVSDVLATGNTDVVLMHCVSVYPCALEDMNLGFLAALKQEFGLPVGLSDHTESNLAAAVAVGVGATCVEKHFTLDRAAPGFDHSYAMEPEGLKSYVCDVRSVDSACTPRAEKLLPAEEEVKLRARRSVYAARDIAQGETLAEADILVVRPEGPLAPNEAGAVVGRQPTSVIAKYQPITWEDLC